jgi:hypothetical protein
VYFDQNLCLVSSVRSIPLHSTFFLLVTCTYRFVKELKERDVEGVNYYDIFGRVAAELNLEQNKIKEQHVVIHECPGHKFFFRPHRQLVELLMGPARNLIKTEQQFRDYLVANPKVLDDVLLKLNERGGI